MKTISKYYGTNMDRESHVYLDEKFYRVRARNEFGSYFVAFFNNVQEAESFAESWVL